MNFFDKLSYGLYWFHVCLKEWHDAVIIGYYDEDEQPSWDFFCHINCNYPLTYRMTMGESKMTNNDRTMPNPIQLTRMIFDHWLTWYSVPHETTRWALDCDTEGLFWYDGHKATFWYMLNVSWYVMNDKLYAYTGCKEPFDDALGDFDPEYLAENYS